ncbi:sirohydrochlorin chelatase [Metabacillus malikii]|uniref:Sirohydrochlorin ferrochelatase n=1 Tax=Metabacillus malikii TaxID=1504265 RepID=A0ABT9ZMY4_9BACI|nr:sirohydrochlorin chelatase [Metabacillus malikii]MDQ0233635.1 sirohydrochlorin ferrochelatase [Metabacillus malikii]
MKQAVLYVCHGSRVPKAREEAIQFINKVIPTIDAPIQEVCFLELAEPSIKIGFETCVEKGATHITVVPLLLLTAAHAKHDIPEEITKICSLYPAITVTYGKPIGVDESLATMLIDKMNDQSNVDASSIAILVGRGSSDMDAVNDLIEISSLLKRDSSIKEVRTCFLTAATPKFEQVIEEIYQTNEPKIFIIPYLIFTGLLKQEIDHTIKKYEWKERQVHVCSYLGPHPILLELFTKRVNDAIRNDGDEYLFQKGV